MSFLPADFRVEIVIFGPPRGLKNSKTPRLVKPKQGQHGAFKCPCCRRGIHVLLPLAKPAREWRKMAVPQIQKAWPYDAPLPKHVRINVCIISYLPTRALPDADNLLGGPLDAMKIAGVYEDDVCVASFDGSRRRYCKENPRTEITITSAPPDIQDDGRQPGLFDQVTGDGNEQNRMV